MGNKTALIGIIGLFIIAVLFMPVKGETAAGGWDWQATLIAPGTGQAVQLPASLYVDAKRERYYLAESAGNRLLSFDRQGVFLNAFSAGGELRSPYDLVRDGKGIIWVVEKGRNSLTSIDLKGQNVTPHILTYHGQELIPDRLDHQDGRFYVLDRKSGNIVMLHEDLTPDRVIDCPDCEGGFVDFKLTSTGEIWALTAKDNRVVHLDAAGKIVMSFQAGAEVRFPVSLALGPSGNVYILDRHEGRINVYDPKGDFKYAFLSKGQLRGQLYYPIELSFDPWGNLIVVEEGNGRAEIFRR